MELPDSVGYVAAVPKKSRHERRAAQAARAISSGDAGALERLAISSPERAVTALAELLAGAAPLDAAIVERACIAAATLRGTGRPSKALVLAEAGAHRSKRLRAEGVLAAVAAGDLARATKLAEGDAEVRELLGPIVGACLGTAPLRCRSDLPLARGLSSIAKAVFETSHGKRERATAALAAIPKELGDALHVGAFRAAVSVAHAKRDATVAAVSALLVAAPLPREEAFVRALTLEAISRDAGLQLDKIFEARGVTGEPLHLARVTRLARKLRSIESRLAFATEVATLGTAAFDADQRATAALYEAFGAAQSARTDAASAFDRAIEHGAPLDETLRGKFVAQMRGNDARAFAKCGERLAHVLARDPDGGPFAFVALLEVARAWSDADDARAAIAAIDAARAIADAGPPNTIAPNALDAVEAEIAADHDLLPRAHAVLDRWLARDPANLSAWLLRLELASEEGDQALLDRLVIEAAAATRDPELMGNARTLRAQRGELAAFEGMSPGDCAVGEVAREIERIADAIKALPEAAVVNPFRSALTPQERSAFDLAVTVIAKRHGGEALARAWWHRCALELISADAPLRFHVDAAAHSAILDEALAVARASKSAPPPHALFALTEAVASIDSSLGARVLNAVAAHLKDTEVRRLRAVCAARATSPTVTKTVETASRLLAPAFALVPASTREKRIGPTPSLHELLEVLGISCKCIHALHPREQDRLEKIAVEAESLPETPRGTAMLSEIFRALKIPPDEVLSAMRRQGNTKASRAR